MDVAALASNLKMMDTGMKISTSVTKKAMDTTNLVGDMILENIQKSTVDVSMAKDPNLGNYIDLRV
ncbi:hypothetical protein OSSY52_01990 [Tepiditoga spiralis]|uniref:Motility protein n=1 Tax=Tepiditoga spiralis TaxID=2108365 RepID=A0A7G1G1K5_9BACT|nr:YjfB family protein [Tepiditoga spiralis]BBE30058.1 hypothetical protein OSSY52_01990 [Tepiditoga spiralis]